MKKLLTRLIACAFLIIMTGIIYYSFSSNSHKETVINAFLFDTYITVTIYDDIDAETLENFNKMCKYYDTLFSADNVNSDIYKINHNLSCEVSDETIYLLNESINASNAAYGALDMTIYPVSKLWDFNGENPHIPENSQINEALKYVDYTMVHVNGNTVSKDDADVQLNLGYIAKGYIADRLSEYLSENGIENAIINLGGNVSIMGARPGQSHYNIAVKMPFTKSEPAVTLSLSGHQSVVTSAIDERCFEKDGILYHHLLSTENGYPVQNGLTSVTIVGPKSTICDLLSTECFLVGKEEACKILESYPEYYAIFIDENDLVTYSYDYQL